MSDQPWFHINRDLLVYKAFYFFFLSGFGSIFPYLPVYFRQIGLPASQVGLLLGLRPIVQFASAPFWAIMADKYRKRKSVLIMSVMAWLIMTLTLAFVEPTNEICEIREGNETHKHLVNYTKVKTGFFKRSLLWLDYRSRIRRKGAIQSSNDFEIVHHKGSAFNLDSSLEPSSMLRRSIPMRLDRVFNLSGVDRPEWKRRLHTAGTTSASHLPQNFRQIHTQSSNSVEGYSVSTSAVQRNVQNKREPNDMFKKKPNNRLKTATSQVIRARDQDINSKHFSRFHKLRTSPDENKRRTSFLQKANIKSMDDHQLRNELQSNKRNQINSKKTQKKEHEGASYSGGKTITPSKNQSNQTKNGNSSATTDKRRENKASPPVVIEFSRIVIPQNKDDNVEGSATDSGSGLADTAANFVPDEVSHHSDMKNAKLEHNRLSLVTASSTNATGKSAAVKAISKHLLQLSKHLSRPKIFDPSIGSENNGFLANQEVQVIRDNSEVGSSTHTKPPISATSNNSTAFLRIHLSSKNNSNGKDILHPGDLNRQETKIVLQNMKPGFHVSTAVAGTSGESISSEKILKHHKETAEISSLTDEQSGSGIGPLETLFLTTVAPNKNTFTESEKEVTLKEDNKSASRNETENATDETTLKNPDSDAVEEDSRKNIALMKINGSRTQHKDEIQLPEQLNKSDDSQLRLWMTNLLKNNPLELKRLFTILLVLVVVGEFLEAPCSTLADASLLEHLGEERRNYGKQRLWGSLGFGLSSFMVGVLLERSRHIVCGDEYTDYMICFCVFAVLMLMTLFISTTFKFKYKETIVEHTRVLSALCNIHYGSCLVAACFMGVGHGMSHSFLNWFLEDLGATKTLMGVAVICRSSFDLMTFFLAGSLIKAVGQIKIMAFSLISYGIAFTLYSLLSNPWWVLPIEMLVGCTYAASWSACTSYMAGAASSDSVTTIQGVLQGVYWGLGTGSGTITGGFLIHHIGAVSTFRIVASSAFVVCVLFCLAQCKWTQDTTEYPQTKYTYLPTVETKDTEELLSGYRVTKAAKTKHNVPKRY